MQCILELNSTKYFYGYVENVGTHDVSVALPNRAFPKEAIVGNFVGTISAY